MYELWEDGEPPTELAFAGPTFWRGVLIGLAISFAGLGLVALIWL